MDLVQTLALALAGVIVVPVLQVLKRSLKLSGAVMAWFAYLCSIATAVVALAVFGKVTVAQLIADPGLLFGSSGLVMATATVVYQSVKERVK